ncbi:hypothetical protein L226DRAFT_448609, partial [Lentinus tigrinus ALCF2SS1-7]
NYDIIALQEPCLTHMGLTASTPGWRVVYPTVHGADGASRTRSLLLVNTRLSTNSWNPIPVRHSYVSAITIRTQDRVVHLLNLY